MGRQLNAFLEDTIKAQVHFGKTNNFISKITAKLFVKSILRTFRLSTGANFIANNVYLVGETFAVCF